MPATILRLEHAELCAGCTDILPMSTVVQVHDDGMVTCLSCADADVRVDRADPWAALDDAELRNLLQRRRLAVAA